MHFAFYFCTLNLFFKPCAHTSPPSINGSSSFLSPQPHYSLTVGPKIEKPPQVKTWPAPSPGLWPLPLSDFSCCYNKISGDKCLEAGTVCCGSQADSISKSWWVGVSTRSAHSHGRASFPTKMKRGGREEGMGRVTHNQGDFPLPLTLSGKALTDTSKAMFYQCLRGVSLPSSGHLRKTITGMMSDSPFSLVGCRVPLL